MGLIILPAKFTDFLFAWKQTFLEFFFLRNKKIMLDYKYWSRFTKKNIYLSLTNVSIYISLKYKFMSLLVW